MRGCSYVRVSLGAGIVKYRNVELHLLLPFKNNKNEKNIIAVHSCNYGDRISRR